MAFKSAVFKKTDECYVCGSPYVEKHHIFYGVANRKLSEQYGMVVALCPEHHRGTHGVHFNKVLDQHLKETAQKYFEAEIGTRDTFRAIFGKSYL